MIIISIVLYCLYTGAMIVHRMLEHSQMNHLKHESMLYRAFDISLTQTRQDSGSCMFGSFAEICIVFRILKQNEKSWWGKGEVMSKSFWWVGLSLYSYSDTFELVNGSLKKCTLWTLKCIQDKPLFLYSDV